MILVDTSVWVNHFRSSDARLSDLLSANQVVVHPFVTGELALGYLRNRSEVLQRLQGLPQAAVATDPEVLYFIEINRIAGAGIGYVDAHLLAAVRLAADAALWTADRRLASVAEGLGLAA